MQNEPDLISQLELPSGQDLEISAPKIIDEKFRIVEPKNNLAFFWRETKHIAIFLALINFFSYVLSSKNIAFANQILSPLSFLAQISAFAFLSFKFLKTKVSFSFLIPIFCAFFTGLFLALAELLYFNREWAIYNLLLSPLWKMFLATIMAIIINIIYKTFYLLTYNKAIPNTLKTN
jgi:hypothetical protein